MKTYAAYVGEPDQVGRRLVIKLLGLNSRNRVVSLFGSAGLESAYYPADHPLLSRVDELRRNAEELVGVTPDQLLGWPARRSADEERLIEALQRAEYDSLRDADDLTQLERIQLRRLVRQFNEPID